MLQVRRLGHVVLGTPDLPGQVAYFTNVLGLRLVDESAGRAVLATPEGIACVVLVSAREAGLAGVTFQLAADVPLAEVSSRLNEAGVTATLRRGLASGAEQVVSFVDPGGIEVELFVGLDFAPPGQPGRGIGPLKLGHVARLVTSPPLLADFYVDVLGFRRSDWCDESAIFLRCGPDHHTINFFEGAPRLQHIAFEVKDWSDLARGADALRSWKLPLDWGPARHHIGHNMACYHSNSDGIRVELFCEMDQMLDEELGFFDPRPWHEDRPQRPKNWGPTPRNAWTPGVP